MPCFVLHPKARGGGQAAGSGSPVPSESRGHGQMISSSSTYQERAIFLSGCRDPGPRPREGWRTEEGATPSSGRAEKSLGALDPGPGSQPPIWPDSHLGTDA